MKLNNKVMKYFRNMSMVCVIIALVFMALKSPEFMVFFMLYAIYLKDMD